PIELVGSDRKRVPRVRRHSEASLPLTLKAFLPHQTSHPLPANVLALGLEVSVDPRAAVSLAARGVRRPDLHLQSSIFLGPATHPTPAPGVEARARHRKRPTEHSHRIDGPLRLDEPKSHRFSFAKKAVAFLRNSPLALRGVGDQSEAETLGPVL